MLASTRWSAALLAALLAMFAAPPAQAEDEATRRARELLAEGQVHYKLREFDLALEKWREAYRLRPVAAIIFNIAQAERLHGDLEGAKFHYEQYLRDAGEVANRKEVERFIREIEGELRAKKMAEAMGALARVPAPESQPEIQPEPQPENRPEQPAEPPRPTSGIVVKLPEPAAPITAPASEVGKPASVVVPAPSEPVEVAASEPEPVSVPEPVSSPRVDSEPVEVAANEPAPASVSEPVTSAPVVKPGPSTSSGVVKPAPEPFTADEELVDVFVVESVRSSPTVPIKTVEPERKGIGAMPVVSFVAAGAAAIAGGVLGMNARTLHQEADAATWQSEAVALAGTAGDRALAANVCYGAAALLSLVGYIGIIAW